jgi:hypothetical protein
VLRAALIPLVLVACLAGCRTPTDYEGRDTFVFFPAIRASIPARPEAPEGDELFFDFDLSGGRGSSGQFLSGGEFIDFDGTTFNGPTVVNGDFDLFVFTATARKPVPIGKKVRTDVLVGLSLEYLDLELSSNGLRARDTSFSVGPLFAGRLGYWPWEELGAYFELHTTLGWGSGAMVMFGGADVGITAQATDQLSVFAGWRWWEYDEERDRSEIHLKLSGPFLGVQFDF